MCLNMSVLCIYMCVRVCVHRTFVFAASWKNGSNRRQRNFDKITNDKQKEIFNEDVLKEASPRTHVTTTIKSDEAGVFASALKMEVSIRGNREKTAKSEKDHRSDKYKGNVHAKTALVKKILRSGIDNKLQNTERSRGI